MGDNLRSRVQLFKMKIRPDAICTICLKGEGQDAEASSHATGESSSIRHDGSGSLAAR